DVLGGDRLTVAPRRALPQVEGVGGGVLRDVPRLGQARDRLEVRVHGEQPVVDERHGQLLGALAGRERVELDRLLVQVEVGRGGVVAPSARSSAAADQQGQGGAERHRGGGCT